eukprot:CAMPEP_0119275418 /NCGR_PEP_ID=MMETSP1329-20130426/13701_1 /TAXON_ID=114041 /ORGANISM="Genus nov. species nov., Strain RCC1024" /LENGTH=730 /DNA_ID=CAMNT_0007275799 /DNA_START=52 /DNA_END=2241 /DNA_ORIENTATION=-
MAGVDVFIFVCAFAGAAFAIWNFVIIQQTKVNPGAGFVNPNSPLNAVTAELKKVEDIHGTIQQGAQAFLRAEYTICVQFLLAFSVLLLILTSCGSSFEDGLFTTVAFLVGGFTSIASGLCGMMIAVDANARTTVAAASEPPSRLTAAFNVAFRAGAVMGFALCAMGIAVLLLLLLLYKGHFDGPESWNTMMDCVAGFGLGGSSVAMFGRVGGGIYTKAADVGADLVGKVVHGLEEDDPKNPATIADNVGDNVGDVAGMGSDLFGSLAEATCAALVIGTTSKDLVAAGWGACVFPVTISAAGVVVCMLSSFIATDLKPVVKPTDVEAALKLQLIVTTFLVVPVTAVLAHVLLPASFDIDSVVSGTITASATGAAVCVSVGALGGLLIGLVTEYYTSHSYQPVRECAYVCKQGAAVNLIYGLALGYKSAIIPVYTLAAIIYFAFTLADLYGVALAALGMLSTLATGLTIDGYGPVTDNAGGIAEMALLPASVREKTDCLDAAGNTTAAIGKGFAIGSAALVSLALYGAFVVRLGITSGVNVLTPLTFAALLVGANLPYWFSAMTMKSVGLAAAEMVTEVERQFKADPSLLDPNSDALPDYDACVAISTRASLREMIAPAALVMLTPLIAGTFFGVEAVFGVLTGGLVSGVQLAVSMSNSGGAWDNAKKYISGGFDPDPALRKKDANGNSTPVHDAAVTGDTVGDPFKDTSGPALNILMKLMAILSLVFAQYF